MTEEIQEDEKKVHRETITREIPRPDISVAQIILLILAQTGRVGFSDLMKHPLTKDLGAIRSENSFYTALARLKRRRLIARATDRAYEITPAGEYAALKAYVRKEFTQTEKKVDTEKISSKKSPTWDGRWRIVFFDVPESKRPVRDYIRGVLKRQGFKEFQRSMWLYPYKIPPFMSKLLADPQIRKYTRLMTTYDIDYDDDLRKIFKLS
jgi:DNA-binding transcriptional regulator PaaX